MCGIVGVAGNIGIKSKKVFNDLLVFDMIRGKDSVGALMVGRGNTGNVVLKDTIMPWEMLIKPEFKAAQDRNNMVLLGHNRWKTKGTITAANAHPFVHDHIIGVHNGTLKTCYDLPDHTKFTVDSDNLYYALSKTSMNELYSKLNGALSLVWWDEDRNKLCFIRNDERPMHMCFSQDKKQLYWASEAPMLSAALKLNSVDRRTIVATDVHDLIEFDIPKAGKAFKSPTITTLEPYKSTTVVYNSTDYWENRRLERANSYGNNGNTALDSVVAKRKEREQLKSLEGEWVEFTLCGVERYQSGSTAVLGLMDNGTNVKCWMSAAKFEEFDYDLEARYGGVVNSVYTLPLIDPDTITMLMFEDDEEEEKEKKVDTSVMTRAQFIKQYTNCCWCKTELSFDDEDLVTIDDETALCGSCSNKPAIINKLKHLIQ